MGKRKKKTALTEHNGTLYVDVKQSGISLLVMMIDGLPIVSFPTSKDRREFIAVKRAAEWHEEEAKHNEPNRHGEAAKILREALRLFDAGEMGYI